MKELTILIPCLNEEKVVGVCVEKAQQLLKENNIDGEVLVIDNGCTDNTAEIARNLGARVEYVAQRGYGQALINGTKLAEGKYIIMGDADDSYNFLEAMPLFEKVKEGYDLVIGNRLKGTIEKGAMKRSHRYIGTPIISALAKLKFDINDVSDFNSGFRAYDKEKIIGLNCSCEGMEYASEMIIRAKLNNLKITEIPVNLYRDGRDCPSNLRTLRDGIRHFKIIMQIKKKGGNVGV